ncbi:MAG: hypothetical protein ACAH80_11630 [Alphaproteobacteria bacterium]
MTGTKSQFLTAPPAPAEEAPAALTGAHLRFMHEQDLVIRHVSSNELLEQHKNTVYGDMYSLSNFGFILTTPNTEDGGYIPRELQLKVKEILQDDADSLVNPVTDKLRNIVANSLSRDPGFQETHFIIMTHPGSHSHSYTTSSGYSETMGKHGRAELKPEAIQAVISFTAEELATAPSLVEATQMMIDKTIQKLGELAEAGAPRGTQYLRHALGVDAVEQALEQKTRDPQGSISSQTEKAGPPAAAKRQLSAANP